MIVQSPHDFCIIICGQRSPGGRREITRAQSEVLWTPYTDITRALYHLHLKSAETLRLPFDLCYVSEHRRKPEQEIVRYPYVNVTTDVVA